MGVGARSLPAHQPIIPMSQPSVPSAEAVAQGFAAAFKDRLEQSRMDKTIAMLKSSAMTDYKASAVVTPADIQVSIVGGKRFSGLAAVAPGHSSGGVVSTFDVNGLYAATSRYQATTRFFGTSVLFVMFDDVDGNPLGFFMGDWIGVSGSEGKNVGKWS